MAEPTSIALATVTTAAGLTIFGVATGLHPGLMFAGFGGGVWALSYLPPMNWWQRILVAVLGALLAGWATPAIALALASFSWWPKTLTLEIVQYPIAVFIGLLAHTAIGPGIIKIAKAKTEGAAK